MVSLIRKGMRLSACVALLVIVALAVLAIILKKDKDVPNGKACAEHRLHNHVGNTGPSGLVI